tara:strand:+ start:6645 stop:6962 length:318 start_codon:yes stop_codon:yes gene_type:complete
MIGFLSAFDGKSVRLRRSGQAAIVCTGCSAPESDRKGNIAVKLTESRPFIFCDLRPKAAEYRDIGNTKPAPSVTFAMTGRKTAAHKEKEAEKTRHNAEHKRDGRL